MLINVLVGSLFMHKLQVLDDPKPCEMDQFNKIVKDFLWGSSKAKLQLEVLHANKNLGGLKLVNISCKAAAFKVKWLFTQDAFFVNPLNEMYPTALGSNYLMCNISNNDVKDTFYPWISNFWPQVFGHWFKLTYKSKNLSEEEINNQVIWYNSLIKINGKMVLCKSLANNGLIFLYQLFDDNGQFKTVEQLTNEYGKGYSWLELSSLLRAIPIEWKTQIKQEGPDPQPSDHLYDQIARSKQKTSMIYNLLIQKEEKTIMQHLDK